MKFRSMLAMAMLALVAGCAIFSRTKSQFYDLQVIPPATGVRSTTGSPIGIRTIDLPPSLARRGIVVEKQDGQLDVRGTEQWGAPLQELVMHTLAFDLAERLPEGKVILPGQVSPPQSAMRSIDLVIGTFAAGPETAVTLDAHWVLDGAPHHEQIRVDSGSLDSPDVVAAMSRALAELADRITSGL